jgi:uroporphyrinogen-III synthase
MSSRYTFFSVTVPWVITRASDEASLLVDALRSAGSLAMALPCIERAATIWEKPVFSERTLVFVTSAAAAQAVLPWLAHQPVRWLACLSPSSSGVLVDAGLKVDIESALGAVQLAATVITRLAAEAPLDIWYPTGQLESAEQREAVRALQTLGAVTRTVVYETRAPPGLRVALSALPDPFNLYFASPSAVSHFVQSTHRQPWLVACWGSSTYEAAVTHFTSVVAIARDKPLVESLHHLGHRHA